MLSIEYVKNLVKKDKEKAKNHIEKLKVKIEKKESEVSEWVYDEKIASYWSHSDALYLSLNSCDFINYHLKSVRAEKLIIDLEKIAKADSNKLEELYFEHVSEYWKKQGITRSKIPKDSASEEFLDRVFNL
ncbi:hypothetical protein K5D34_04500 [Pseudomonas cichorii]|nr:hypothetical protein [Pseudomonas cichorii]MBX8508953.1 hypothetical protein [Pseudomonas cichorii]MBX8524516.1 hypothetical protein [Pseudomonas cichorii]